MSELLSSIRIRGFRSAHDVTLQPGAITALVGAPGTGKSNLLLAIWKLLAPEAAPIEPADASVGIGRSVSLGATLRSGATLSLDTAVPGTAVRDAARAPEALFLPASERAEGLVPRGSSPPAMLQQALEQGPSPALALLSALDDALAHHQTGLVLMIEEPELFLRPHAQRALYRLLRAFSGLGNQVIYSTHAASFLNVSRLDEIALVERDAGGVTSIRRPVPLPQEETFRALNEFDAERSELLLSQAALLVEGRTEKLVFPFLFRALGYDIDREGISIVECGGKPNIPIIAEVCNAVDIPYMVVHDRDAAAGRRPIASEIAANEAIARVAGRSRTVELARDFEAVAQLHGHRHKPERAWQWFVHADSADDVPEPLAAVVRRMVALARNGGDAA